MNIRIRGYTVTVNFIEFYLLEFANLFQAHAPIRCCELMYTRAEALNVPCTHIELATHQHTGLIFNKNHDGSTQLFSDNYEGSQSSSAHFSNYTSKLIDRLADKYQLADKLVMEIGCGDGAFLKAMCAKAKCKGVGVDPACKAGIVSDDDEYVVELFAERLSNHHAKLKPDFIICRHTLEHIANPVQFLREIRALIDDKQNACLYLDVPDTKRIIEEGAFWDVYYEHAHYFTADSLEKTLSQSGFVVENISREYGEQYLCATAYFDQNYSLPPDRDDGTEHLQYNGELVRLSKSTSAKLDAWKNWFCENGDAKTVLWGGGSKAVSFVSNLALKDEISAIVDIHPRKQGCYLPGSGHDVISPDELILLSPDNVIVMNPVYLNEIRLTLNELGIFPQLISVNNPEVKMRSGNISS